MDKPNKIKETIDYVFREEKAERQLKIMRGCDTYGLYEFGKHCGNENCEPCNNSMKQLKEEVEKQMNDLK